MTNTKWLRRALLGSVALGVMATGAHADELSELKAQLEGLQSRVNQLEQQPVAPALPEGTSFLTLSRGSAEMPNYGTQLGRDKHQIASDRGFTIAVTPTADLPAPVAEVVVYGFVKGDVIYDFDKDLGDAFSVPGLWSSDGADGDHIRIHARQSRFGIRSRTDTAIGQIRTQIEGDFFGARSTSPSNHLFRLRHAIGEWDMTPAWTLLIGQTSSTASLHPLGVGVVDFSGYAGPNSYPRKGQVRMTYHSGPITWAVAIERPRFTSDANWPNLAAYLQFDAPGGHQFIVTGVVADHGDTFDDDLGWAVQAGANINLADIAALTVGALYGEQEHCAYLAQVGSFCSTDGINANKSATLTDGVFNPSTGVFDNDIFVFDGVDFFSDEGWGLFAGLNFGLTDTTTLNVIYGISHLENGFGGSDIDDVTVQTLHANILWRPVRQMQLGWEVMWGEYDFSGGDFDFVSADGETRSDARQSDDAIRAQFGAWFFF